jgi:hypothetical protein
VTTIQNPIRRALQLFFLLTGQRDEATRLMNWEHVDFKRGRIHFPEPKGGEARAFDLPTSAEVRQVLEFVRTFSEQGWAYASNEWVWPTTKRKGGIGPTRESKEQRREELLNAHSLRRTLSLSATSVRPASTSPTSSTNGVRDVITDSYFVPSFEAVGRTLVTVDAAILQKIGDTHRSAFREPDKALKQYGGARYGASPGSFLSPIPSMRSEEESSIGSAGHSSSSLDDCSHLSPLLTATLTANRNASGFFGC